MNLQYNTVPIFDPIDTESSIDSPTLPSLEVETAIKLPNGKADLNPVEWTANQIAEAYAVYAKNSEVYIDMLTQNPKLPPIKILLDWVSKINFKEGLLESVLQVMDIRNPKKQEKLCVLMADEMNIQSKFYYDEADDYIHGPANKVYVILVQGLLEDFSFPLYYCYDSKLTKDLIINIVVNQLTLLNYNCVAVVFDLNSHNRTIRNVPYFINALIDQKIYLFWDTSHLLNSLRTHICDDYIYYKNKKINKTPLEDLLEKDDVGLLLNLSKKHFNLYFKSTDKEKYSKKFFSKQNSNGLKKMGLKQIINSPNWKELADFMKIVHDWYDVFNSNHTNIDNHRTIDILLKMESAMVAANSFKFRHFQKAVINNITTLKMFSNDLKTKFNIDTIPTRNLNQHFLEHLFNDHFKNFGFYAPKTNEFENRLKTYLLSNFKEFISILSLDSPNSLQFDERKNLLSNLDVIIYPNNPILTKLEYETLKEEAIVLRDVINPEMLEKYYESNNPTVGFLMKLRELKGIFNDFNSTSMPLKVGTSYLKSLIAISINVNIEANIKKFYFINKIHSEIIFFNNHSR